MLILIDANVIIRYLLNDIKEQADEAEKIIDSGAFTLPEIIAEVVYVLKNVYAMPREEIANCVMSVLAQIDIENKHVMFRTLQIYSQTSFDFVDCELIARVEILGDKVFTFDKKLARRLSY